MKHKKIEASAANAGPGVLLADEPGSYTENPGQSLAQTATFPPMPERSSGIADWRQALIEWGRFDAVHVVTGDLGPIEVIGSPRVVVAVRGNSTFVWGARLPWAWPDATREFLKPYSKAANRYAVELATKLRDEAVREAARRERKLDAKAREREAIRRSREGSL